MDLALPRLGSFDGRVAPAWKPWPVSILRCPQKSPQFRRIFFQLRCFVIQKKDIPPVRSDQISSDEDLPSGSRTEDRWQVVQTKDLPSKRSVSMDRPADVMVTQRPI